MKQTSTPAENAVLALWVLIALAAVLMALGVAYIGSINAPFGDEWRFINPHEYLSNLFEKYHGHPLVIGRLALALDYWLFDARGWALRAATFTVMGLWAVSVVLLNRTTGPQTWITQALMGAAALVVVYNGQSAQNLFWGFQVIFVLAFAATTGAVAALAAYAAAPRRWKLALTIALSLIASLSLGSGLLAPLILLAMALALRLPARATVAIAILAAITWAGFFLSPGGAATERMTLENLPDKIVLGLRTLGCAPGLTLAYVLHPDRGVASSNGYAAAFGAIQIVLTLWFAYLSFRQTPRNPGRIGALALILFAMGSAGLVALVREDVSRHYVAISSTMIVGLLVLGASFFPKQASPALRYAALAAAGLALALIPIGTFQLLRELGVRHNARTLAQSALVVGLPQHARRTLGARFPVRLIAESAEDLRARGKWTFQDPWSRTFGSVVAAGGLPACEQSGFRLARRPGGPDALRLAGRVSRAQSRAASSVVVLDGDGVMRGYGLVLKELGDLYPINGQTRRTWVGFARVGDGAGANELTAYLAGPDRLMCRIGRVRADAPPRAPRRQRANRPPRAEP